MNSVVLISGTAAPCGVEHFARTLADRLVACGNGSHVTMPLTGQPGEAAVLARLLADRDTLVVNLPVVAWKRRIAAPARAMLAARRTGRDVLLILHEWADLDWKRRIAYLAYLPLATRILFSSPLVKAGFEADTAARIATRSRGLVPIPPNMARPNDLPRTALAAKLETLRGNSAILIASFGAIYPKKQPTAVLDIAAALVRRGLGAHCVFIGDYVRGGAADSEAELAAAIAARGLAGSVTVTGYIADAADLFAALAVPHVLVYRFAEGLTARRGSVLASLQSGRPVVVNAPAVATELASHPTFQRALASGQLVLVPHVASASDFAAAILAAQHRIACPSAVDFDAAWADVLAAVRPPSPK